jgi:hypothetical protein
LFRSFFAAESGILRGQFLESRVQSRILVLQQRRHLFRRFEISDLLDAQHVPLLITSGNPTASSL